MESRRELRVGEWRRYETASGGYRYVKLGEHLLSYVSDAFRIVDPTGYRSTLNGDTLREHTRPVDARTAARLEQELFVNLL